MSRIESFKMALEEKRAVKIIAGIDNFDAESVKKISALLSSPENKVINATEKLINELKDLKIKNGL